MPPSQGSRNRNAILSEKEVREIRRLYETTEITQYELAAQFGVTQPQISQIVTRRTWKHVK